MDLKRFEKISKALSDLRRVQILEDISNCPHQTCREVVEKTEIGQPTVSHHLKILKDADLVDYKKEGQHIILWANNETLAEYLETLKSRLMARAIS